MYIDGIGVITETINNLTNNMFHDIPIWRFMTSL